MNPRHRLEKVSARRSSLTKQFVCYFHFSSPEKFSVKFYHQKNEIAVQEENFEWARFMIWKSIIQLKHSNVIKFIIWRHSFTTLIPKLLFQQYTFLSCTKSRENLLIVARWYFPTHILPPNTPEHIHQVAVFVSRFPHAVLIALKKNNEKETGRRKGWYEGLGRVQRMKKIL